MADNKSNDAFVSFDRVQKSYDGENLVVKEGLSRACHSVHAVPDPGGGDLLVDIWELDAQERVPSGSVGFFAEKSAEKRDCGVSIQPVPVAEKGEEQRGEPV